MSKSLDYLAKEFFAGQQANASMSQMMKNARGNMSATQYTDNTLGARGGGDNGQEQARLGEIMDSASMIEAMGDSTVGRGPQKSNLSPAQQYGLFPQNPQFFGLYRKEPIPYYKIIGDGQNLYQMLKGFSEKSSASPGDAAQVIAQIQRRQSLISEAFQKGPQNTLYAGINLDPAANLYYIQLRRQRENSIYSFQ